MKRLLNIFLALLLAQMIIVMSVGFGMVYCAHSGQMSLITEAETATEPSGEHCSSPDEHCMRRITAKISPSVQTQNISMASMSWPVAVPFFLQSMPPGSTTVLPHPSRPGKYRLQPPRSYLRLLRTLLL